MRKRSQAFVTNFSVCVSMWGKKKSTWGLFSSLAEQGHWVRCVLFLHRQLWRLYDFETTNRMLFIQCLLLVVLVCLGCTFHVIRLSVHL